MPYHHPLRLPLGPAFNGNTAVILLSFILAAGFLLVILSCALWANWLPLLVGKLLRSSFWFTKKLIYENQPSHLSSRRSLTGYALAVPRPTTSPQNTTLPISILAAS